LVGFHVGGAGPQKLFPATLSFVDDARVTHFLIFRLITTSRSESFFRLYPSVIVPPPSFSDAGSGPGTGPGFFFFADRFPHSAP